MKRHAEPTMLTMFYSAIKHVLCDTIHTKDSTPQYQDIGYDETWYDSIPNHTIQHHSTSFIPYQSITCQNNIIQHHTAAIAQALLWPRRAENWRIFPCQWQLFMWHTILYHTIPHLCHNNNTIPCQTIIHHTIPRFPANGKILCDTPYHTTPMPYQTIPRHTQSPYHTTFPSQWQHFMWHPTLSHHTHTLAFQSHLLPWLSPKLFQWSWMVKLIVTDDIHYRWWRTVTVSQLLL